ncbi:HEAT repeat domain-containing protein [Alkalinema pantanalense CENA528]|uniref:HEAT repeat domain-containing protein n=1 Tax=Alkalinema pantanalense TaxID=1620705 RepID=UPI003D6FEF8C
MASCSPNRQSHCRPLNHDLKPCLQWVWIVCLVGIGSWMPTSALSASAQSASPSTQPVQAAAEKSAPTSEKSAEKKAQPSPPSSARSLSKPSLKKMLIPGLMGLSVVGVGVGTVALLLRRSTIGQFPQVAPDPAGPQGTPAPQGYIPLTQRVAPVASVPTTPAPATPASEIPAPATPAPATPAPATPASEIPVPVPTDSEPQVNPVIAPSIEASTTTVLPTHSSPPLRLSKHNVVDALLQELQQCDPQKRQKVIWELGQRGDSRAVQPLVDLLLDSDSREQSLILSALSEIGTRTLKPMSRALALSLQNENADVRKNAIRDVTRIYDLVAQISQLLHTATEDPDTEVQATAQWALAKVNRIK